ncbi:MAG: hypothetical protein AAGA48_18705 [Myxococcota bacterium]
MGPSDRTVRLHSWGLRNASEEPGRWAYTETFRREEGQLVLRARPCELRRIALALAACRLVRGETYSYFADNERSSYWVDGEVQIFQDFHRRLTDARRARLELGFPVIGPLLESQQWQVWQAGEQLRGARSGRYRR